ncbi:hypothetical protein Goshw_027541 [Gossypium schwendimanii]|uniref:Uncharacterized protein n=1 Tax=Gossypium schwendimanii TaxID=34291 RepID=A0A7J9MW28_GOSSC|nr:hypothetical protein [Gossypium schwendimanii]
MMRKPNNGSTITTTNNKLRKGLWSPDEDDKLINYMLTNGQGCWSDVARNAGLQRCGKSCRLRWINYLRPDLKRGAISPEEEELIVHLHSILGNRLKNSSPNTTGSSTSNFNKDSNPVGFITMEQQGVLLPAYIDLSSTSSNSSLQSTVTNPGTAFGATVGYFATNVNCMYGENEMLCGEELYMPPLETVRENLKIENTFESDITTTTTNNNNNNNIVDCSMKSENVMTGAAVGNFWLGEEIKVGDWDLEDLMKDVSSFPFLDFQS